MKRLNGQYVSSKATRMDAMNLEIEYRLGVLKQTVEGTFEDYLKKTALYTYSKIGRGFNSSSLNEKVLTKLIQTPFNGANYAESVGLNVDELAKSIKEVLRVGFIKGSHPRVMAQDLMKKVNISRARAQTIIRTDGTMVINNSIAQRYIDAGLKHYRILVHMDDRTTKICRKHHKENKVYDLKDFKAGITAPPFHYNCRSAIVPDKDELNDDIETIEDKGTNYFQDVTSDWIDGRDHNPQISVLNEYTKNDTTYKVDGHHVVIDHSNYEYRVANWLSKKTGLRVDIVPRVNFPEKISTPDYLVNGVPFDLKEITGSGKNVIDGNLRKTKKQAPNIIFDITKTPLSSEEIMGQLEHIYMIDRRGLEISIIKNNDEILAILEKERR